MYINKKTKPFPAILCKKNLKNFTLIPQYFYFAYLISNILDYFYYVLCLWRWKIRLEVARKREKRETWFECSHYGHKIKPIMV
jgi:hypothetical protein